MKHLLCELILSCVMASPGAKPLDELTYGTVLYSYYQEDFQQALLGVMVAEAQDRRGADPTRFDLAEGSFAFSDRMFETAGQTFAAIDPDELSELDRMRLAFHMAREYHRRGDYPGMARELARITLDGSGRGRDRLHPEVEFMRAEVAMAGGDLAAADALLAQLEDGDPLLAYGLFNLGVAYRAAGQPAAAQRAFQRLADSRGEDPEVRDLVQRAKLALAYIAREQRRGADAAEVLGGLPGAGRYREVALASYGDLAMDNEDFELAARIWLTLQDADDWTSSTAQARLAFPLSLEGMASREMALAQYRQAERSFTERLTLLESLSEQARDPSWVRSLLLAFSEPERGESELAEAVTRWRAVLGHTDWLEWLAAEDTHQVLLEWRELLSMLDWLALLPDQLAAFEEVAAERHRRSAEAGSMLEAKDLLEQRAWLEQKVDDAGQLIAALKDAEPDRTGGWMMRLASARERALIEELATARALTARHMPADDRSEWFARIDRLQGVVFWQIADQRARRIRELDKQQRANTELLEDLDSAIARVARAESEFVAGVETDFLAFSRRAGELTVEVGDALNRREVALATELRRGMGREIQELQQYLLATRIGIARATDALAASGDTVEGE